MLSLSILQFVVWIWRCGNPELVRATMQAGYVPAWVIQRVGSCLRGGMLVPNQPPFLPAAQPSRACPFLASRWRGAGSECSSPPPFTHTYRDHQICYIATLYVQEDNFLTRNVPGKHIDLFFLSLIFSSLGTNKFVIYTYWTMPSNNKWLN